jgi:transcriptional regulator with XRE-family HTH domain
LAKRAGVSYGTLKKFERTGRISLESLLKIALVLDALDDFKALFLKKAESYESLDALLKEEQRPKRGKIR